MRKRTRRQRALSLRNQGMPGSHVILQGPPGTAPDRETLHRAAAIAAYQSKARTAGVVAVRHAPGTSANPGRKSGHGPDPPRESVPDPPARGDLAGNRSRLSLTRWPARSSPRRPDDLRSRALTRAPGCAWRPGQGPQPPDRRGLLLSLRWFSEGQELPKGQQGQPVATRPQSVAIPRSMAGISQCSRRPRPSPHPQIPPSRSPNTVTQPSIAGLPFPLAMMLPQGPRRASAGEYTPGVRLVQGHAWHAHGRAPAVLYVMASLAHVIPGPGGVSAGPPPALTRAHGSGGRCWGRGSSRYGRWRGRLESPQKLDGPFLVHDHSHEILVIPDGPQATLRIVVHAELRRLLLRVGRRATALRAVAPYVFVLAGG